jgi:WD40 repeat protein
MTAVHNVLEDEYEIYNLGSSSPIRLLVSANSGKIKGAAFAEAGSTLVCGGDDGFVHIFDTITGVESQALNHDGEI